MTKPIIIYYHTYLVGNYKLLIHEQLLKLFTSGLYKECKNIYIGISSHDDSNTNWVLNLIKNYDKIIPLVFEENDAERSTLRFLMDMATKGDYYFYYYMTKNVATNTGIKSDMTQDQIIKNELWRVSMEYNTIDKWKECIQLMEEGYDAVGCNLRPNSHVGDHIHFSGNFWWAKSELINTLNHNYLYDTNLLGPQNALLAEFWIGSNKNGKLKEIFECGTTAPYIKETTFNEYIK
jgi:hypothetical protein